MELFAAGLTLALVILTGYYAVTTRRILKANQSAVDEMRRQHDALYRASVIPTLVHRGFAVSLVLENLGKLPAENVRVLGLGLSTKQPPFGDPIKQFMPGERVEYHVMDIWKERRKLTGEQAYIPKSLEFTLSYFDGLRDIADPYALDLRHYLIASPTPRGIEAEPMRHNKTLEQINRKLALIEEYVTRKEK